MRKFSNVRPRDPARPLVTKQARAQRRELYDVGGPSLTDQSQAKLTDVNVIMDRYTKTGQLTHLRQQQGIFEDVSQIQGLHEAFEAVEFAKDSFNSLPAKIRAHLGNDPTKLVGFMTDPKNQDVLMEYGLIKKSAAFEAAQTAKAEKKSPPPAEPAAEPASKK